MGNCFHVDSKLAQFRIHVMEKQYETTFSVNFIPKHGKFETLSLCENKNAARNTA